MEFLTFADLRDYGNESNLCTSTTFSPQNKSASNTGRRSSRDGEAFRDAAPNACHRAIACLEKAGKVTAVVTQNIDGLHQKAGSAPEHVVEVHGTNAQTTCLDCGRRDDPGPAMIFFREKRSAPRCSCGGLLKPATISFGQGLDEAVLQRAVEAAQRAPTRCSLWDRRYLCIRRRVSPCSRPDGVFRTESSTQGETDHDELASFKVDDDVVATLSAAVDALAL